MNVSEQIRWGQSVCSLLQRHRAGTLSVQQQAELPAELLDEKLGWVESFADSLVVWSELIDLGQQACSLVGVGDTRMVGPNKSTKLYRQR